MTFSGRTTQDLVQADNRLIADALKIRMFPLVVERASGSSVFDPDGKEYLDFFANWAVSALGYSATKVHERAREVFEQMTFATPTTLISAPTVDLAAKLCEITPGDFEKKVWFGLSGSDANDSAVKMVRMATGRRKIISFIGGYHGQTGASASISGHTAQARTAAGEDNVLVPYPNAFRPLFRGEDEGQAVLSYLENLIFNSVCPPDEVAAIFVEPIQSDGGDIAPPPGFLAGLADVCRRHGIYLVSDEVKVGMGRTGAWFGVDEEQVVPDLVVLGKSLGGGLPLSAVVGRKEILDAGVAVSLHTMGGHPVAAATALAQIEVIEDEGLLERAQRLGETFLTRLSQMAERHQAIGDIRGRGLMIGVELVSDRQSRAPGADLAAKVSFRCYQKGLILPYVGLLSNVLEVTPPLTLSDEDAERGLDILDEALADVAAGMVSDEDIAEFAGW